MWVEIRNEGHVKANKITMFLLNSKIEYQSEEENYQNIIKANNYDRVLGLL